MKLFFAFFLSLVLVVSSFRVGMAEDFGTKIYNDLANLVWGKVTNSVTTGIFTGAIPTLLDFPLIILTGCDSGNLTKMAKDPASGIPSCFKPALTGSTAYRGEQGLLGVAIEGAGNIGVDNIPVNLAYYIDGTKNESLVFKNSYAAGTGGVDGMFSRVYKVWATVRNLSYGLLAIIVLIISIMISNRSKVDAQNVVTAQAMIPKIIIAAILITFSYAIGALFIQMGGLFGPISKIVISFFGGSAHDLIGDGERMRVLSANCANPEAIATISDLMQCNVGGIILNGVWSIVGIMITILTGILPAIIVLLAMVFVYLTRYFKILFLTILAPVIFVISVLPGQEDKISGWFKDLTGAVLGIPAMLFIFLLGSYLHLSMVAFSGGMFSHGLLNGAWDLVLANLLFIIMGVYALKAPGLVDNFIKGPPPKRK